MSASTSVLNLSSAAPSTSSLPPSTPDNRMVILGAIIGVIGTFIIVGTIFMALRMRKRKRMQRDEELAQSLQRDEVALRVTPFGSPSSEISRPSFVHTPGVNMRVAHRTVDGSWRFAVPTEGSLASAGKSQVYLLSSSPNKIHRSKSSEALMNHTSGYLHMNHLDAVPPPAYTEAPSSTSSRE